MTIKVHPVVAENFVEVIYELIPRTTYKSTKAVFIVTVLPSIGKHHITSTLVYLLQLVMC